LIYSEGIACRVRRDRLYSTCHQCQSWRGNNLWC